MIVTPSEKLVGEIDGLGAAGTDIAPRRFAEAGGLAALMRWNR
jgi:hypothetical protein